MKLQIFARLYPYKHRGVKNFEWKNGNAGKAFVAEMFRLLEIIINNSAGATSFLCFLSASCASTETIKDIEKPDHVNCLQQRLDKWNKGVPDGLLKKSDQNQRIFRHGG